MAAHNISALHLRTSGLLSCTLIYFLMLMGVSVAQRPNIIVIFSDDHGFSDLECQGIQTDVKTPHINALATAGVRLTSGYVTAPQCVPSRAGLLSGKYQNRFGVESNAEPLDGFDDQPTIAERLRQAGYATGMTGKWHLGPAQHIVSHGFQDVFYKNSNQPGWANFELDGRDREAGVEHYDLYHLDANSAAACAFIARHHAQPFFFYCAYRAPHVPLDAPPHYLSRFPGKMPERRRQALAMISAMDDGVGKIMKALRDYELEEKTLIFFIGDNGAPLKIDKLDAPGGGPGWDGSLNEPLNGEKGMLAEGGIRVPFIVQWKGRIPGGQVYDLPVISLDVAATAVELAGIQTSDVLDGVNLLPFLAGETNSPPHEALYWRWIAQSAIREGNWKYLRGGSREYLFNLDIDREEKNNLLAKHPETAQRLSRKLEAWASQMSPPGLETKSMSVTWESYYDHYLDGKPGVKAQLSKDSLGDDAIEGWVVRGGTASKLEHALKIDSDSKAKQKPFLAQTDINLPGPIVATARLRCVQGGVAGFAWRTVGEKVFSADHQVSQILAASEDWQELKLQMPANGKVIHVRLLLPSGSTEIDHIKFQAANEMVEWQF